MIKPRGKLSLDEVDVDLSPAWNIPMRDAVEKKDEQPKAPQNKQVRQVKQVETRTNDLNESSEISVKLPSGKHVTSFRVLVDPNDTRMFEGNPRNNAQRKEDVAQLQALIEQTGGNVVPAWARTLPDGTVQVIAGFRRRLACIQAGCMLLLDMFLDIDDDDAYFLTKLENSGRIDPDPVAMCQHYASRYDSKSIRDQGVTMEEFGKQNGISRQKMQSRVSVGRMPKEIFNLIGAHIDWTYKALDELRSEIREAQNTDNYSKVIIELSELKSPTPRKVIKVIRDVMNKRQRVRNVLKLGSNGRYGSIEYSGTGSVRVNIAKDIPESIREGIKKQIKGIEDIFSKLE